MKEIEIQCEDGRLLAAHWVRSTGSSPALATIVIHSATAVRRGFYNAFAQHLSEHGLDVILWDTRGIGESATLPMRNEPATMRNWGQLDQQAVLKYVQAQHSERPMIIVGHSSGGHLTGLASLTAKADALILIASGVCYWRDYPRTQWLRLLAVWWVGMPPLLALWGYLPAWAGIGQALPRGVAAEWRRWSLTRGYLFGDPTLDTRGYDAYVGPLLALSISDDKGYSPIGTVKALLLRFTNASIEHKEIHADEGYQGRIGHFGFFKLKNASLWPQVTDWLRVRGLCE